MADNGWYRRDDGTGFIVVFLGSDAEALAVGNGFDAQNSSDDDWTRDTQVRNSFAHTQVSASITFHQGRTTAETLGNWKEGELSNNNTIDSEDEYKDQYNNELGRRLAEWLEQWLALEEQAGRTYTDEEIAGFLDDLVVDSNDRDHMLWDPEDERLDNFSADPMGNFQDPAGDVTWFAPSLNWTGKSNGRDYQMSDEIDENPVGFYLEFAGEAGQATLDAFLGQQTLDSLQLALGIVNWILDDDVPEDGNWAPTDWTPQWLDDLLVDWGLAGETVSPLILDLGTSGIELIDVDAQNTLFWDIDLDGFGEKSGWVGSDDGLLAIDLNGDGRINDHSELFGTATTDGFTVLSAYDTNGDSIIDASDTQFGDLIVWIDANSNAYSEESELYTLSDLAITSISLTATNVNYQIAGNDVTHESTFTMNGQSHTIIDAWFAYDDVVSVYSNDYNLNEVTLTLPTLRGYGEIPALHVAMSLDSTLLDMVQEIYDASFDGTIFDANFDLSGKIEEMMFRWAGVDGVDPTSRGSYVDARELEFLEKLLADNFIQFGTTDTNPASATGSMIEDLFDKAFAALTTQFLLQTDAKDAVSSTATYDYYSGLIDGGSVINYVTDLSDFSGTIVTSDLDDFFIYNANSGTNKITDLGGEDRIIFGDGIEAQDVRFQKYGNDLEIHIGSDKITLDDQLRNDSSPYDQRLVETAVFADGSVLDLFNNLTFTGTTADETVLGLDDDNILVGAGGNDTLLGELGNDSYLYNLGDGNDKIIDDGGIDQIVFGAGITQNDLRLEKDGNDLDILIGSAQITLDDQFRDSTATYAARLVETAAFSDGSTLDLVNNLTFTGTSANETVKGWKGNDTLLGEDGNDNLYGDEGDDILYGGDGTDNLYGEEGADTFMLEAGDTGIDVIQDFSLSEGDMINLADLLTAFDPLTDLITDFVEITTSSSDSILKVDTDGGADNFVQIAKIDDVTGLEDEATLLTNGTLIVA